eukprot:comp27894_c0_seq1/m.47183 comp27894_c0_seq1/g.47183  ORF comp27894_c0_seq1/g.47183 comp27894_c0_seq1/m.47183 type:complete len:193 (-) comp27894_c0_seq1:626-1204(-)
MAAQAAWKPLRPASTVFFLCDIQTKFQSAIRGFPQLLAVAKRLMDAAKLLDVPVVATEQYPQGLGPLVDDLKDPHVQIFSKVTFSMVTPEMESYLKANPARNAVVLFGLETHVCVQQTALDLLSRGYQVHLLADGVSSRTKQDRECAIERLRQAGSIVTTSESVMFELMGDSKHPAFRDIQKLIRNPIEAID